MWEPYPQWVSMGFSHRGIKYFRVDNAQAVLSYISSGKTHVSHACCDVKRLYTALRYFVIKHIASEGKNKTISPILALLFGKFF